MAFKLNQETPAAGAERTSEPVARQEGSFSISSRPVVAETEHDSSSDEGAELPRSYLTQTIWLMPRDPESLFAFWDVDWPAVFQDEAPAERKVHLRLMRADGSEETAVEVEPMAGSCYIRLQKADQSYTAEIGFYQPADIWNSVASSAAVQMPSREIDEAKDADFATIPLHLSFQRMIDVFRLTHHESASLTDMLRELRERVNSADGTAFVSSAEREIVRALDTAVAETSQPEFGPASTPDLWARMEAGRVLGFGATSPGGGFGGSSRSA